MPVGFGQWVAIIKLYAVRPMGWTDARERTKKWQAYFERIEKCARRANQRGASSPAFPSQSHGRLGVKWISPHWRLFSGNGKCPPELYPRQDRQPWLPWSHYPGNCKAAIGDLIFWWVVCLAFHIGLPKTRFIVCKIKTLNSACKKHRLVAHLFH